MLNEARGSNTQDEANTMHHTRVWLCLWDSVWWHAHGPHMTYVVMRVLTVLYVRSEVIRCMAVMLGDATLATGCGHSCQLLCQTNFRTAQ